MKKKLLTFVILALAVTAVTWNLAAAGDSQWSKSKKRPGDCGQLPGIPAVFIQEHQRTGGGI